jgi:hypothetical protein
MSHTNVSGLGKYASRTKVDTSLYLARLSQQPHSHVRRKTISQAIYPVVLKPMPPHYGRNTGLSQKSRPSLRIELDARLFIFTLARHSKKRNEQTEKRENDYLNFIFRANEEVYSCTYR